MYEFCHNSFLTLKVSWKGHVNLRLGFSETPLISSQPAPGKYIDKVISPNCDCDIKKLVPVTQSEFSFLLLWVCALCQNLHLNCPCEKQNQNKLDDYFRDIKEKQIKKISDRNKKNKGE